MTPMPNNPLSPTQTPPDDGRQSEAARDIGRGATRLLRAHDFACLPEFTLPSGRRADIFAVSGKSAIWIIEIKSSVADFRTDTKWSEYREFCDRLFFAVAPDFPIEILPQDTGLILADRFGADFERQAPEHALPAARRKALTLRFGRAAADRLSLLADPALIGTNSDIRS
ncbi:MAG: MmcB family DNA repair protein [Filomicrobium sp.]